VEPEERRRMPFWKKEKEVDTNKEKINYKARLEHKQYLVSSTILLLQCGKETLYFEKL
jgi:hypothetical protein